MKKEKQGYITVYLALILGILITFVFTLIEAVRIQTIRTETEGVMDIGLFSVFGEFHRELLEQFDLFYIDTTYGEGKPNIKRSEEHLQYYMNQNFENSIKSTFFKYRDLTDLHCDNVEFDAYMLASDEEGEVLKRQIVEYMQEKKKITEVERTVKELLNLKNSGKLSRDVEGEWSKANENVQNIVEERKKDFIDPETGEQMDVGIDNPSDYVKQKRLEGILGLAMPKGKRVSTASVSLSKYFSHRKAMKGKGTLKKDTDILDKVSQKLLLREYLLEKCGHFHQSTEKNYLKYQIEYLLHGKNSDLKNLKAVLEDILHIRQVLNIIYLFSDSEKVKEANDLAWIISLALFTPELQEAVKISILYAWSYAESVKDIRILIDGEKVPLFKNKTNWNTPLSQLLTFQSDLGSYKKVSNGMDYGDYLSYFLQLQSEKQLLYRFMDICEMDIRMTAGNDNFQMDGCIEAIKATANVSSGYGHGFQITRTSTY